MENKEVIERSCSHCGDKDNLSLYDHGAIKGNTREMVFTCSSCNKLTYVFYYETPEQTANGKSGTWIFKGNEEERKLAIETISKTTGDKIKRFLVVPVDLPYGHKLGRVVAAPSAEVAEVFFRKRTGYTGILMTGEKG